VEFNNAKQTFSQFEFETPVVDDKLGRISDLAQSNSQFDQKYHFEIRIWARIWFINLNSTEFSLNMA